MKKPESICVFGDSTAWGAWDMEKGGWVNRLWFYVAKRDEDYVELYNCSVSGGVSKTILDRFESEATIRKAEALIFQTGGNDASYLHTPDNIMVPLDQFRKNIQEIIDRARKITDKIVFLDLKNCDESRTTPVWWDEFYVTNENIQKYSQTLEDICKENNVLFIDIPILDNEDLDDGLHPSASGHEKIFQTVKVFLEQNNWI